MLGFNTHFRAGLWHPRYKSNPLSPLLNSYIWRQGSGLILGSFPYYTPPLPEPERKGRSGRSTAVGAPDCFSPREGGRRRPLGSPSSAPPKAGAGGVTGAFFLRRILTLPKKEDDISGVASPHPGGGRRDEVFPPPRFLAERTRARHLPRGWGV